MRRGKPLRRVAPLRRTPLKPAGRSTGPARDVVDAVYERAAHSCEVCGTGLGPVRGVDHHLHHRRPRAAGGSRREDTNTPANLLLLCPGCHADIESRRADALNHGYLISQVCDPASSPVLIHGERWLYLTVSGRYASYPPSWRLRGEDR
jgi:5-methylcytosine-specific restriction protein A